MSKYLKSGTFFFLLILLVSIPAILPLLRPGFFPVHDNTQVQRVYEMGKSLMDGVFPVRFVMGLGYGYGYPIFNFYAPLAYYLGGLLSILGLTALTATKLMFTIGILFSGVSMFLLSREFWGKWGGAVSAVFYVYAPYHALNIYVRGAVGEFFAYSFIPLVFLSIYLVYKKRSWSYAVLGSLSFGAVIISHNLTAFMLTPFLILATTAVLWKFYKDRDFSAATKLISVFVLGIMLSAFYSLPALLELKYTDVSSIVGGGSDFRNHFVCLPQLWSSIWGFGGSNPGCIDGISFRIGKIHLLLAGLVLLFLFVGRKNRNVLVLALIGLASSVFLTLGISRSIWEAVPPMEFLQFPWRFLALASFFSSFIAGAIVLYADKFFPNKKIATAGVSLFLVLGALLLYAKLFIPQRYINIPQASYISNKTIAWDTSKVSDEYMPRDFNFPKKYSDIPTSKFIPQDGLDGRVLRLKTNELSMLFNSSKNTTLAFNVAYFPAWRSFIDGKSVPVSSSRGLVVVKIPQGKHRVDLKFIQTDIERLANLLSFAGIALLFAGIILGIKKK